MSAEDSLHCLKNLLQLMCCDGSIHDREKRFLKKAADELSVTVDDWNGLLKEVLRDNIPYYPVSDRDKALAVLKALMLMAKADGKVDEKEKQYVLGFAKSIGANRNEWKQAVGTIDADTVFTPFEPVTGQILAVTDDFDKLDAFLQVAGENGATVKTSDLKRLLQGTAPPQALVCFHAASEKEESVSRCHLLLGKTDAVVCILTRFQGHQVKYLHESGLRKCVIEPVYARDITDILKLLS